MLHKQNKKSLELRGGVMISAEKLPQHLLRTVAGKNFHRLIQQ